MRGPGVITVTLNLNPRSTLHPEIRVYLIDDDLSRGIESESN